jgi:hypothetical protein
MVSDIPAVAALQQGYIVTVTPQLPTGNPMDISQHDSLTNLSKDEKDCRRHQGKCLYCGGDGHFTLTCPTKPATHAYIALTLTPYTTCPELSLLENTLSLS